MHLNTAIQFGFVNATLGPINASNDRIRITVRVSPLFSALGATVWSSEIRVDDVGHWRARRTARRDAGCRHDRLDALHEPPHDRLAQHSR